MSTDSLLVSALLYIVVPAWLAFGLADWQCHRRAQIERNAGVRESFLHIAQFTVVGIPLLAVLFLQVNAAIMLLMLVAVVAHQAIAVIDVRYANATRVVSPAEQHVHGGLEALPVAATFLVIVLHWNEFRALWGGGASFALAFKQPPLPAWYLAAVLVAVGLFGVLPYAEELRRTLRARRSSVARMD
ncbi:MAG: diguanylate cyclase [Alphaproteobacteria bacterium]|nr:diguanylate cyclase [Alphaproteobacteria bacterium]